MNAIAEKRQDVATRTRATVIGEIATSIAKAFNIQPMQLISGNKNTTDVVNARRVCFFILRKALETNEIGRAFKFSRGHVFQSISKMDDRMAKDLNLFKKLSTLDESQANRISELQALSN
tara:strand:- start:1581 stop:1940 length:360 start_codon:yes stop_codon:yes gene_type:complete